MMLDEALARIDRKQVDGLSMAYSQTGETYTVIVSGGVKPEGERHPILCSFESEAVKHWLAAFNEYAKDKAGTVYWRVRPEMNSWVVYEEGDTRREFGDRVYVVYARLLISDKPVLPKDAELVKTYYEDMAKRAA